MPKPCAYNMLREAPHYRRDGFSAGLAAVGFDVRIGPPTLVRPGDVVLSWNRYHQNHDICSRAEKAGAMVLIAENGYVGPGGVEPHGMDTRVWYALGRSGHNDEGAIPEGDGSRWASLGVDLKPWRADGGHVLVCPNRPFGTPGRIMPETWAKDTHRRLLKFTGREVRIRLHPGAAPAKKPLADDLAGAWACVVWSSSAGVHALVAGIPVICCAPFWIARSAAGSNVAEIESPPMPDRLPVMQRLAWGQWSIDEIATGEPFRRLIC